MGLGMGATMMPIMSSALASLKHEMVARGSTLMNIVQQSAGSIGTAVMSVILTNQVLNRPAASTYVGTIQTGVPVDQVPAEISGPGQASLADAFGATFWVALVLIVLCLVPAFFLPRKRAADITDEADAPAAAIPMH